jgi:putative CocE/NonD family hydrolase
MLKHLEWGFPEKKTRTAVPAMLIGAAFFALLCTASAIAQEFRVAVEPGVLVKMRDGVSLVADVYHPDVPGKYPVLLQRTPYNRRDAVTGMLLASHGYVVVLQDTRGRFDSEGEFYPFKYESQDGYDTVEWAAGLEYSNGKVGMFGGSYVGATQMLASISHPPHLAAIFPYVTASEYYEGWTYQSGALMQWFAGSWTSGLAEDTLRRKANALSNPKQWVAQMPVESYRLLALPEVAALASYYRDWVQHERQDEYWEPWKISSRYDQTAVKALHGGGWHDLFLKGSIENYLGMRKSAATAEAREGQRLLLGPWAHAATSAEGKIGDVVFGKAAVLDMDQAILHWFDYALKGSRNEYASPAPVRIFVMGENAWRDEQEFPLARTSYTKYFLDSAGPANSISGSGTLSVELPKGKQPDGFEYDPMNSVPTIGGRLCCGAGIPPGPFDQRPNESRQDVLVFSTPALERDVEATGYVRLELYAASSAVDTDFTALLVDVDPAGYARFLTDGIARARYRNSTQKSDLIEPGRIYKYDIDLWATSNVFKAGHRIRLYVSSSNFPRFNRNLNTGEQTFGSTRALKAQQTIYHDAAHPSALVLPVIPVQNRKM